MKPGDLLKRRSWNSKYSVPITRLNVWNKPEGLNGWQGTWDEGETGVLLEGKHVKRGTHLPYESTLVEVLLKGKICWVDQDYVTVLNEAR